MIPLSVKEIAEACAGRIDGAVHGASLGLPGELTFETVRRGGFRATYAKVVAPHEHAHRHWHHIEAIIDQSILTPRQKDLATRKQVVTGVSEHPDVREFERTGAAIGIDQAREIITLASRTPVEGRRKVLILHEFHLLRDEAAAVKLYRDAGVRVIPGSYLAREQSDGFNPGAGYIRLALVSDSESTAEALHRLVETLD